MQKGPRITPPFTKPHYFESLLNGALETIRFYSSFHRAYTYSGGWLGEAKIDTLRKRKYLSNNRTHLHLSTANNWNLHSPKLSRSEFNAIIAKKEMLQEYVEKVLRKPFKAYENRTLDNEKDREELFVEFTNSLEDEWRFHRAYYKVFFDAARERTKLYIELDAYFSTRHVQYIMRKALHYLEGNYVVSLRQNNKVFIPHLQFPDESVECHYTSEKGLDVEHLIADYLIKEKITSVAEILERFEKIAYLKEDVAKAERKHIFLNPTKYIDRDKYLEMQRNWIRQLDFDYGNPNSIRSGLNLKQLEINMDIFLKKNLKREDLINYESDLEIFLKDGDRAKRRLLQDLFEDLLQYSINRYRFEEREGPATTESRSEYENVFRAYRNMSLLEQNTGCLLIESGEISFFLLLQHHIQDATALDEIENLVQWGLVEETKAGADKYSFTVRTRRMAFWACKLMLLKYRRGKHSLDFTNKPVIAKNYNPLTDNLFSWMKDLSGRGQIAQLLGEIVFPIKQQLSKTEIINHICSLCSFLYAKQDDEIKKRIDYSVENTRFNKQINEFLFNFETIHRSVIVIPISTIPTEVEEKTRTFSIFIGTFNLENKLNTDNEVVFEKARREVTDLLNLAKIFFVLVGKPASESMSDAVLRMYAHEQVESSLGRFQHKLKNDALVLVSLMDRLYQEVDSHGSCRAIKPEVSELKEAIDRLTGTIQLLNIATNGLREKYLETVPFCIFDAVVEAYCNAFQHFYTTGAGEKADKLYMEGKKGFRVPTVSFVTQIGENGAAKFKKKNKVIYKPKLKNVKFANSTASKNKVLDYHFRAEDIIDDLEFISEFNARFPESRILQSPFYEIFINALTYMSKDPKDFALEISTTKTGDEFIVEITNKLEKNFIYNSTIKERIENSAGIAANEQFFKNIGGGFVFKIYPQEKIASARVIININELKKKLFENEGLTDVSI